MFFNSIVPLIVVLSGALYVIFNDDVYKLNIRGLFCLINFVDKTGSSALLLLLLLLSVTNVAIIFYYIYSNL